MKVINRVNKSLKLDDSSVGGSPLKNVNRSTTNLSPMARNNTSPVRSYKMNYTSPYKISQNRSTKFTQKVNA